VTKLVTWQQAGGTGFIAVMAITGFPAEEMRPTALLLNFIAAGFATWCLQDGKRSNARVMTRATGVPMAF